MSYELTAVDWKRDLRGEIHEVFENETHKAVSGKIGRTDGLEQNTAHVMAYFNKPELLRKLIKAGIDVNKVSLRKEMPLDMAVEKNHSECIDILVEAGAKITLEHVKSSLSRDYHWNPIEDAIAETAIQKVIDYAAEQGNIEVIQEIIKYLKSSSYDEVIKKRKNPKTKKFELVRERHARLWLQSLDLPEIFKAILILESDGTAASFL